MTVQLARTRGGSLMSGSSPMRAELDDDGLDWVVGAGFCAFAFFVFTFWAVAWLVSKVIGL